MSSVKAALVAGSIRGNTQVEVFLRKKLLEERGATMDQNRQCYKLGEKLISVEMALFGSMEVLARFLEQEEP